MGRNPHAGQEDFLFISVGLEGQSRASGQSCHEFLGRCLFDLDLGLRLGRLGLDRRPDAPLALAFNASVGDELAEQPDGADGVVVGRNDVVELVSPVPMIGSSSLRASVTAMRSR
jgi:hypothetical protein